MIKEKINSDMIKIIPITNSKDFRDLRFEWNKLLSNGNSNTVFLTWEWLYTWWEAFQEGKELMILSVRKEDDTELIGLLPIYIREDRLFGLKKVKIGEFLGTGIVCSDYLDIIIRSGFEEIVTNQLVQYLVSQKREFDFLTLSDIPSDSPNLPTIEKHLKEAGFSLRKLKESICPFLPLSDSWQGCLKYLSSRTQKNLAYYQRRLQREFSVEVESGNNQGDSNCGIDILSRLHQNRWESKGEPGLFKNARFEQFHSNIIREFSDQGWLRLFFLKLNGQYVASIYGFRYCDKYYYYQGGFDETLKKYSVGQVLLYLYIQRAFEEKSKEFDFLRGVSPYKYEWTEHERHNLTFFVGRRDVTEKLALLSRDWKARVRNELKQMMPNRIQKYIRQKLHSSRIRSG